MEEGQGLTRFWRSLARNDKDQSNWRAKTRDNREWGLFGEFITKILVFMEILLKSIIMLPNEFQQSSKNYDLVEFCAASKLETTLWVWFLILKAYGKEKLIQIIFFGYFLPYLDLGYSY